MGRKKKGQLQFNIKSRGGARRGAGRKPKGDRAGVSHHGREALASRHPVHIGQRVVGGLPNLRWKKQRTVIQEAIEAAKDNGCFRITDWSVQRGHLHLVCEAEHRCALSRGLQGLFIRIAKKLNKHLNRGGRVFVDRYFSRILRTPREVRNALAYVLNNARHHGIAYDERQADPCSSGIWFGGWKEPPTNYDPADGALARPKTWLRRIGWRKHGLLRLAEVPG